MKPHSCHFPVLNWSVIEQMTAQKRLVADSRQVQPGDVFLAFAGDSTDGRKYIPAAIAAGASAVLWDDDHFYWDSRWQVPHLAIPALREQAGIIAAHVYGNPSQALWVVGVTGTNGKTSIAYWLAQAFNAVGKRTALVGTLGNGFIDELANADLTTPDAVTLARLLAHYRQQGASHIAMEVSSHALTQGRVHGVAFDVAVFTNLSRDHLDYHGSMQHYGQAKTRLFEWEGLRAAVINADDVLGGELIKTVRVPTVLGYGIEQGDIRATRIAASLAGLMIEVSTPWGEVTLSSQAIGRFNVYNLLATLSALLVSDLSLQQAAEVIAKMVPATGRMQTLGGNGALPLVIVDYAHTPDALEKALATVREMMPTDGKLCCVFGCGGGRDKGKRPAMAEAVAAFADVIMVTNDNPRHEDPQQIIDDIVAALPTNRRIVVESDREKAIAIAIQQAQPHDVIVIAGKGHEAYQEINGVRYPLSDVAIATQQLAEWRRPI